MTYRAEKCPCGMQTCRAWHVTGVAAVQGVSFTEEQARQVAQLMTAMDEGARFAWMPTASTHQDDRGVVRQDHYGSGRQPWDDIVEVGWGPEFAAGNVLKYLRRTKEPEHSLKSAVWYWMRLYEMASDLTTYPRARGVQIELQNMLSTDELRELLAGCADHVRARWSN